MKKKTRRANPAGAALMRESPVARRQLDRNAIVPYDCDPVKRKGGIMETNPYIPVMPDHVSYQRTFRVPFLGRVWVRVPARHYRKRVSAFVGHGSSIDDMCVGQARSNGAWVLNDGVNLYRIKTF